MDINQLIKDTRHRYRSTLTYQDRGYVTIRLDPGASYEHASTIAFITRFVRPDVFLSGMKISGWAPEALYNAIWCDGDIAYEEDFDHRVRALREINLALEYRLITRYDSRTQLRLLNGNDELFDRWRYPEVTREYMGIEAVCGEACHVIRLVQIESTGPVEHRLWISTTRLVVRKIRRCEIDTSVDIHGDNGTSPAQMPLLQAMLRQQQADIDAEGRRTEVWTAAALDREIWAYSQIIETTFLDVVLNERIPFEKIVPRSESA